MRPLYTTEGDDNEMGGGSNQAGSEKLLSAYRTITVLG